jgi:alpha-L-fucosidase
MTRLMRHTTNACIRLAVAGLLLAVTTACAAPKIMPMQTGKFKPTWESLAQYQAPDWFRDAKFGIWAHWGPQCQPEQGDWFARNMYLVSNPDFKYFISHYGPQSQVGFKDVIHQWKAQNWDPEKLMALYKRAGAQYFVALANHHDNFDLWNSTYQPWNAVALGPQKNLIAGWAKAARHNGLKFGVSEHASHAWMWYEPSQGADATGPFKGVPYDGKMTKADGKGKWWDGLDPQDLYAQNHIANPAKSSRNWDWAPIPGVALPDKAYCDKFYNRTLDLINKYHPDLLYFDDDALPLWPVSDVGLKIAAHYYNASMKWHDGKLEAVMLGKQLTEQQRHCLVWDIERGVSNKAEPLPWQTDTCIGSWHYKRSIYDHHGYKSAKTVIRTLADIVSKNGNLLLSVPVRGDGTIDDQEQAIVEGIAAWMDVNRESIFGTRPWKVFGEGPATAGAAPIRAQGFNEGRGKPMGAQDVRFTAKGDVLYMIEMGVPTELLRVKALGTDAKLYDGQIGQIELLGSKSPVQWEQGADALTIQPPTEKPASDVALVYKITRK